MKCDVSFELRLDELYNCAIRRMSDTAMIRTLSIACKLPNQTADALNRESGRIYTEVMVEHYRVYRHHNLWLNNPKMQKYHDRISKASFLHAHSIDAAQEAFYKACKTAKAN